METATLVEPRYLDGAAMRIVGLSGEYTREQTGDIPKLWEQFNGELYRGNVAGLIDDWTLGVVYPSSPMRYVTGVAIDTDALVPEGWVEVTVPAQKYVVFAETGGIPAIRRVWMTIFSDWLPKAEVKVGEGPMIERYPEDWVRSGDFEIWIPVAR